MYIFSSNITESIWSFPHCKFLIYDSFYITCKLFMHQKWFVSIKFNYFHRALIETTVSNGEVVAMYERGYSEVDWSAANSKAGHLQHLSNYSAQAWYQKLVTKRRNSSILQVFTFLFIYRFFKSFLYNIHFSK